MKYAPTALLLLLFLGACDFKKNQIENSRSLSSELGGGASNAPLTIEVTPPAPVRLTTAPEITLVPDDTGELTRPRIRPKGLSVTSGDWDPPGLTGIGTKFNSQCTNFIRKDGSYGAWGHGMIQAMRAVEEAKGESIFFGDSSSMVKVGSRCRSTEYFKSLPKHKQEHIWVWFWASVAQAESSCRTSAKVNGIWNKRFGRYNIADGLFQLEYHTETRNANGRSRKFCPDKTNTQAVEFQFRCAASIMANTQSGRFLRDATPRGKKRYTYWEKLRRNGGQIFNLLKEHPLCR